MLRRNIDTSTGLVNGAIGTVLSIRKDHLTVQFDYISEPYDVEEVKSRFISLDFGLGCDHSRMPRPVVRLCHSRPL